MGDDWFTDLLHEVAAELVGSPDTQEKLSRAPRMTPERLTAILTGEAPGSEDAEPGLRDRLQAALREVDLAETAKLRAILEEVPQAFALDAAVRRREGFVRTFGENGKGLGSQSETRDFFGVLDQTLKDVFVASGGATFAVWAANRAAERAQRNFDAAVTSERVLKYENVRQAEGRRASALTQLRIALLLALSTTVNEIIDAELEARYDREFSYVGDAFLGDALDGSTQEPVVTEPYLKVRYLIDKVGSGVIGVAGPRGSGKSTLLSRFAVTDNRGSSPQWGVCVSAPTRYDSRDFLLHLFGQLCVAVLGRWRISELEAGITSTTPVTFARRGSRHTEEPASPDVYRAAGDWYRRVKFQQSYTTGWSGTITLGTASVPAQLQVGRTGGTGITVLAMSTPEIVDAFRSFTNELSGPRHADGVRTPIVIGIDEVDKIEDPQEARAFFNQIKALFSDSNCLFLISISDEAMAAFERRGMPLRDAFDSSLSAVITLSYLTRAQARVLIGSRLVGVQEPAADLLYTLSGGLAREVVRHIRRAVEARAAAETAGEQAAAGADGTAGLDKYSLDALAMTLTAGEVQAQQRAVLALGRSLEPCPGKVKLLEWAARPFWVSPEKDADAARSHFSRLLAAAEELGSSCPGGHSDSCVARETGAVLYWLATVGQVFLCCQTREHFELAELLNAEIGKIERTSPDRTFAHLATVRQNFPLGPDYVLAASKAARKAWDLD